MMAARRIITAVAWWELLVMASTQKAPTLRGAGNEVIPVDEAFLRPPPVTSLSVGGDGNASAPVPTPAPAQEDQNCGTVKRTATVFHQLGKELKVQLMHGHQGFNALVAFLIGLVMLFDGEFCFRKLVVLCVGIFFYELSRAEIHAVWNGQFSLIIERFASLEVAVAAAVITYKGYPGVKILIGLLLGFYLAYFTHGVKWVSDNDWVQFVVGNICVFFGLWIFIGKTHQRVAAVLCSILGGALVSSAIGFFMKLLCVKTGWLVQPLNIDVTPDSHWIEFLESLFVPHSQDKGIFADSLYNPKVSGHVWPLDFVLGLIMWIGLTMIGFYYQLKLEKEEEAKKALAGAATSAAGAAQQPWWKKLSARNKDTTDPLGESLLRS